jgi:trk system potassium uptake protein TrkH
MGIIVLSVAILPLLGVGGLQLYRAGAPGFVKDAKLAPRIIATAKSLGLVYGALTLACTISLWAAGMSLFDAICHAFSTLSLGGFSTHDANIAYFHSPLIEMLLMVFMLIAALNFATHFLALRKGDFSVYSRDPEARWMLWLIFASCIGISACSSISSTSTAAICGAAALCGLQRDLDGHRPAASTTPITAAGRSSRRFGCCF